MIKALIINLYVKAKRMPHECFRCGKNFPSVDPHCNLDARIDFCDDCFSKIRKRICKDCGINCGCVDNYRCIMFNSCDKFLPYENEFLCRDCQIKILRTCEKCRGKEWRC